MNLTVKASSWSAMIAELWSSRVEIENGKVGHELLQSPLCFEGIWHTPDIARAKTA